MNSTKALSARGSVPRKHAAALRELERRDRDRRARATFLDELNEAMKTGSTEKVERVFQQWKGKAPDDVRDIMHIMPKYRGIIG